MPKTNVKRYKKKKSTKVSKPWYSRSYTPMELATKAAKGVWYLKGLINSEIYKHDVVETGFFVTSSQTSYCFNLNGIAVGDGDSDRTGNSIFMRSLNIKGQLIYNASGSSPQFVRLIIFCDTQQISDTNPSLANVLENNGYNSHLNNQTVGRFNILYSKVFALYSGDKPVVNFSFNRVMRLHARYNGALGSDIQKNGLYIAAISSEPTDGPKIVYNSRLSYHDN